MKNSLIEVLSVIIVVIQFLSCRRLNEFNPSNPSADVIWNTPQGFVTNVNAAYSEQRNWYGKEDGIFMSESGTDLWYNRDRNTYSAQLSQYAGLGSTTGNFVRSTWTRFWVAINLCNAGINRINNAGFTDSAEKRRREGELRFLRAFYYWHIVETWGGVMLRTEETNSPILTATRSSVPQFYDLIISDLQYAAANLPKQSFWGNEYSRASNKSALGFLARAYLSRAYYSTGAERDNYFTLARNVATDVIARKNELETDLWASAEELWNPANNKRNKEALYIISNSTNVGLNIDVQGNRTFQVFQTPFVGKPGLDTSLAYGYENNRRLMPTRALLDYFNESIDARYNASFQEVWIANRQDNPATATDERFVWTEALATTYRKDPSVIGRIIRPGVDTGMYITKKTITDERFRPYLVIDRDSMYNPNGTIKNGRDFVTLKKFMDPFRTSAVSTAGYQDILVMRLAEMYLIAAEAEFQLGDAAAAATHINVLRTRAAVKTPVDQTAAMQVSAADITIDFILEERARELCGEYIRWFDVKRVKGNSNNGQDFVNFIKTRNPDITQVQNYHVLRPIRQEELNSLSNAAEFGQNPGYGQ
jgi:hypothetical protein